MLEWLKTILGEGYTEEIDKKVSEEIGRGFVAKADFNTKNEALKELESQLKDRDKQLGELKKVDAGKLQEEIERLQGENKAAKESYDSKVKQLELDRALDVALLTGKARDAKAVKPFLNMEGIQYQDGKLTGLDAQLESLRKEKDFLFETIEKPGEITIDSGGEHGGGGGSVDTFIAAARKAAGLPDASTSKE